MRSFKKCGISVAGDGSEDFQINMKGIDNYTTYDGTDDDEDSFASLSSDEGEDTYDEENEEVEEEERENEEAEEEEEKEAKEVEMTRKLSRKRKKPNYVCVNHHINLDTIIMKIIVIINAA